MFPCPSCLSLGYCRKLRAQIVTDDELSNPEFLRDVRILAGSRCISRRMWRDYLCDLYRDYRGRILNAQGDEVFLDIEELEGVSEYWFRDFCISPKPGVRPRLRREARERVRVLATILRACFPGEAQMWGVRAANDNEPRGQFRRIN